MNTNPDFWIEVNYHNGDPATFPFLGTRNEAESRIRQIVAMDSNRWIDFVLLFSGEWKPGTVAAQSQILADAQGYMVKGAKRYANG